MPNFANDKCVRALFDRFNPRYARIRWRTGAIARRSRLDRASRDTEQYAKDDEKVSS
jgi:hypothetical protein